MSKRIPAHLFAVMDGKVCMSGFRAAEDWQDAHEVRARMVAKYGPESCDEPGGACFPVYLTSEQIKEFTVPGDVHICPICGTHSRIAPLSESDKGKVYKCPECSVEATVKGDRCAVVWNDEVKRIWAEQHPSFRRSLKDAAKA